MNSSMKSKFLYINKRSTPFILAYVVFLFNYILNGYEFGATVESVRLTAAALLLFVCVQKRRKDSFLYINGFLLICIAIISTLFSDVVNLGESRVFNLIFCMIVFIVLSDTFIEVNSFEKILYFYTNFAFILAAIVLIGYVVGFGVDSYGRASIYYGSFYKDQNYLSAYLMPAFTIKVYRFLIGKRKAFSDLLYPITIILAVLLMGSRGAFVTALLIVCLIILKLILFDSNSTHKFFWIMLVFVAAIVVYAVLSKTPLFQRMTGFSEYGSDVRIRLWTAGLNGFWRHKFIGSGVGAASQFAWQMIGNAVHNSFIELLSDNGLIGVILVFWSFSRIFCARTNHKVLIVAFFTGLFMPLFFLTGYSNMTFWMPMFFLQNFISYLEQKTIMIEDNEMRADK